MKGRNFTVHELTANIDIAPTLLEIAGATPPGCMDGRSLLPLVAAGEGQGQGVPGAAVSDGPVAPPWREMFLVEYVATGTRTNRHANIWYPTGDVQGGLGTGPDGPQMFRFPNGSYNCRMGASVRDKGTCWYTGHQPYDSFRGLRVRSPKDNLVRVLRWQLPCDRSSYLAPAVQLSPTMSSVAEPELFFCPQWPW